MLPLRFALHETKYETAFAFKKTSRDNIAVGMRNIGSA
jgi:hypothetical protein